VGTSHGSSRLGADRQRCRCQAFLRISVRLPAAINRARTSSGSSVFFVLVHALHVLRYCLALDQVRLSAAPRDVEPDRGRDALAHGLASQIWTSLVPITFFPASWLTYLLSLARMLLRGSASTKALVQQAPLEVLAGHGPGAGPTWFTSPTKIRPPSASFWARSCRPRWPPTSRSPMKSS
jgi:hypothetical protein